MRWIHAVPIHSLPLNFRRIAAIIFLMESVEAFLPHFSSWKLSAHEVFQMTGEFLSKPLHIFEVPVRLSVHIFLKVKRRKSMHYQIPLSIYCIIHRKLLKYRRTNTKDQRDNRRLNENVALDFWLRLGVFLEIGNQSMQNSCHQRSPQVKKRHFNEPSNIKKILQYWEIQD